MNQALQDEEDGTPPALRRLLPSQIRKDARIADVIETEVARSFGLRRKKLHMTCRIHCIVWPRQVAIRLIREMTGFNVREIGVRFSLHHGTVLYACKLVEDLIHSHHKLHTEFFEIQARISEIIEQEGL